MLGSTWVADLRWPWACNFREWIEQIYDVGWSERRQPGNAHLRHRYLHWPNARSSRSQGRDTPTEYARAGFARSSSLEQHTRLCPEDISLEDFKQPDQHLHLSAVVGRAVSLRESSDSMLWHSCHPSPCSFGNNNPRLCWNEDHFQSNEEDHRRSLTSTVLMAPPMIESKTSAPFSSIPMRIDDLELAYAHRSHARPRKKYSLSILHHFHRRDTDEQSDEFVHRFLIILQFFLRWQMRECCSNGKCIALSKQRDQTMYETRASTYCIAFLPLFIDEQS